MVKAKPTTIAFDVDVREALEKKAEELDRSMNWVVNKILRDSLIGDKKK